MVQSCTISFDWKSAQSKTKCIWNAADIRLIEFELVRHTADQLGKVWGLDRVGYLAAQSMPRRRSSLAWGTSKSAATWQSEE
ncbi:hypothetical protein KS4_25370 [Poriferisphaera corsica]|uniref:Uncharacterized protein n=1 Tax=Poriferisphaera corsica TaxID=2528020 RepID=A0A517YW82_9BACT|nr:hypothetical protein KS4_25370 [Poriferisphaera corsica]